MNKELGWINQSHRKAHSAEKSPSQTGERAVDVRRYSMRRIEYSTEFEAKLVAGNQLRNQLGNLTLPAQVPTDSRKSSVD